MRPTVIVSKEIQDRPSGYVGPNLDPAGLELIPKEFGEGVVALIASPPPKDNGGVIYGSRAALVVDAGVNGDVARQIQSLVRQVSPVPLRYLANTTYHGDHTFGNAAFPDDVVIVSSYQNKASMSDLQSEKRIRSGNMHGNVGALADVSIWRKPDVTFDRFLEIDLGGQTVELWHFGPGNAPGDTVVYAPSAKVAWTGNFLGHSRIAPMLLEGSPVSYVASLKAMKETLDARTIVPGHGPVDDAQQAIDAMIAYLEWLYDAVSQRVRAGDGESDSIDLVPPPDLLRLPAGAPGRDQLE
jgi:cyclase